MLLTPYKVFQIHKASFLHFNTSYDYITNYGVTVYKQAEFEARKDKEVYYSLCQEFKDADYNIGAFEYYVAWLNYAVDWVTPKTIRENQARYMLEWTNFSKKRLHNFKMDMLKLHQNADPSSILNKLELGDIHYSSLLILNRFTNIISLMDKELESKSNWISKSYKLKKFEPFYFYHEPIIGSVFIPNIPETLCRV